jgi:hypothetical protein
MTRDQAVSFIRNTLGCACHDDILGAISRETWNNPDICCHTLEAIEPKTREYVHEIIVVGGRLIVLVCGVAGEEELALLLNAGVSMRDQMNYNQIRIAFKGTLARDGITDRLLAGYDERIHIHPLGASRDR